MREGMSFWKKKRELLLETGERAKENAHRMAHSAVDKALEILLSPVRAFKLLCFSIGLGVILFTIIATIAIYSYLSTLPNMHQLKFRDLRLIATGKAQEMARSNGRRFRWTTLDEMSREYLYSIVISEDATFFEHSGFNFEMIANSLAENIKEQKMAYGASTISQQVVKNLFLTPEKTLSRKLKEVIITRELESHFSKNEILELYLNIAEFGPEIIGVHAAASHYFRKTPRAINAAEGAFIGLMLPSPKRHYYTIYQNRNLTRVKKKKIERVLRDMLYEEYLTERQYSEYTRYNYFRGRGGEERLPARTIPRDDE